MSSVVVSPNARMLASGGDDGVRLWDLRTYKPLGKPLTGGPAAQVAFSPDGRLLASVGNGTRLWDVRTHAQVGAPLGGEAEAYGGRALAFSADGRMLADFGTSTGSDAIRLWDVATHGQLGGPLPSPLAALVAFNSDGRRLTSVDYDGIIRVWPIFWRNHAELQRRVCGLLGSGLSRSEWKRYAAGIAYHQGCP